MNFRGYPFLLSGVTVAAVAGLVAILIPLGAASAPPRYTVERLGTLGGMSSHARAINDRGDVAGYWRIDSGPRSHGFVHANGAMIDIGGVGNDCCTAAYDVNDNGEVVGYSDFAGEAWPRPSLYADGAHTYLFDVYALGIALSINASGQITGWRNTPLGNRAFFLSGGSVTYLDTLGGMYSYGHGLNDRGDIVGESTTMPPSPDVTSGPPHAFLYASGTMRDLGTLGGSSSSANAINNAGHITGRATTSGDTAQHAFIYANGAMSDLGTLGGPSSEGRSINDAGWIVGRSVNAGGESRPFLYVDGSMHDINDLVVTDLGGDTIDFAEGINSRGQIAASACTSDRSRCVAVRLDPIAEQRTTEVPVLSPAMLVVIAMALGGIGAWHSRRRRVS